MTEDALKAQIAESLRFYGDMRFKQLTLFMAAMTAAGAGVMQFSLGRWWIALAALFVTAVMWVVEVRATLNAIAAHDTIPEVFPKRSAMFWLWLNSSWAVLLLHMACYVVWLYCVGSWALRGASFYIGGGLASHSPSSRLLAIGNRESFAWVQDSLCSQFTVGE